MGPEIHVESFKSEADERVAWSAGNIMPLFWPCRFPNSLNSITHVYIKPSGFIMNISQHHFTVHIKNFLGYLG